MKNPFSKEASLKKTEAETISKHPFRRLVVFQVKLALDALRDIALSPVALLATLLDIIDNRHGKNSFFEKLMHLGRVSERHINLFEQHKQKTKTVDSVLTQVEDILVNEYKKGELSAKAKNAIEKKLNIKSKAGHQAEPTESEEKSKKPS